MELEPTDEHIGEPAGAARRPGAHRSRLRAAPPAAGEWDHTHKVSDAIQVTTSRDVLAAMARGEGPSRCLHRARLRRLGSGQLEREMRTTPGSPMPVDARVVFELPFEERWHGAWRLLGIDVERLSSDQRRSCLRPRPDRTVLRLRFRYSNASASPPATRSPAAPRPGPPPGRQPGPDWDAIAREVRALAARGLLVVGAPYNVDGSAGALAGAARALRRRARAPLRAPGRTWSMSAAPPSRRARSSRRSARAASAAARAPRRHRQRRGGVILERWLRGRRRKTMSRSAATLRTARGRLAAPPAHPRGAAARRDRAAARARADASCAPLGRAPPRSQALAGVTVANLFTEPSTRTRVSFELAAQAARRRCRQSGSAALLARQGREHARHRLHAAGAARRRARDPRRRGRRSRTRRGARGAARERAVGGRGARRPIRRRGCSMR